MRGVLSMMFARSALIALAPIRWRPTLTTLPAVDASPVPLRIGVVGLGYAGSTHIEAYAAIPGVR